MNFNVIDFNPLLLWLILTLSQNRIPITFKKKGGAVLMSAPSVSKCPHRFLIITSFLAQLVTSGASCTVPAPALELFSSRCTVPFTGGEWCWESKIWMLAMHLLPLCPNSQVLSQETVRTHTHFCHFSVFQNFNTEKPEVAYRLKQLTKPMTKYL